MERCKGMNEQKSTFIEMTKIKLLSISFEYYETRLLKSQVWDCKYFMPYINESTR